MTKKKQLSELVQACGEIINVAEEHSYLRDNPELWKGEKVESDYQKNLRFTLFSGFVCQDEDYYITFSRIRGKFVFDGRNFIAGNRDPANLKEVASGFLGYNISAEELKERFYSILKEPLGIFLADKYLKKRGLT